MNLYRSNKKGGTTPAGNKAITIDNVGTTSGIDVANYATASVTTDGLYKPSGIKDNTGSSYTTNGTKTITGLENYTGVKFNVSVSSSLSETLLWTNPSPASSISAQIKTLDSYNFSDFTYIKVVFRGGTSSAGQSHESSVIMSLSDFVLTDDANLCYFICGAYKADGNNYIRRIWYDSNTSFHIGTGLRTSDNVTSNGSVIPYKIYGLK